MFVGPVFTREVATAPRRLRLYISRAAYVGILWMLMCTAWMVVTGTQLVRNVGDLARFGATLFQILAPLQLAIMVFFAALATASAVSQEKDRRTLDLLLMTRLSNSELVLGKLMASLLNVLVVLLAALPLFMAITLFGGVSTGQVLRVFAVTAGAALMAGSLGSLIALWREKTFQALALTVLVLVFWIGGWEALRLLGRGHEPALVRLQGRDQAVDPFPAGGAGANDGRHVRLLGSRRWTRGRARAVRRVSGRQMPRPLRRWHGERDHQLEIADGGVRALAVGLVHREDVRALDDAGLDRLHLVAHAGRDHHHRALSQMHDLELVLADADRLDQHDLRPPRVHQPGEVRHRTRQAPERPPRRHRPDEHAGVFEMVLHTDAIPQDRTAAEGAGRIDRQHRDARRTSPERSDQAIGQRALAGAGAARDADRPRAARVRIELTQELLVARRPVVDPAGGPRQGTHLTIQDRSGQRVHRG